MSRIQSAASTATSGATTTGKGAGGIEDLDLQSFFDLMIAELQNQDPLNPMDNQEMLAQIGQIREISSNDKLSETLDSVLLGQNFASATSLLGTNVTALTDKGQRVTGDVQKITMDNGEAKLDLAVKPLATKATADAKMEDGEYTYEVVWENAEGKFYGVPITVNTEDIDQFAGSLQLNNLPETTTEKRIYRTDSQGGGERRLVGVVVNGSTTTFTDTLADRGRLAEIMPDDIYRLATANRVTVSLKNVGEILPKSSE